MLVAFVTTFISTAIGSFIGCGLYDWAKRRFMDWRYPLIRGDCSDYKVQARGGAGGVTPGADGESGEGVDGGRGGQGGHGYSDLTKQFQEEQAKRGNPINKPRTMWGPQGDEQGK